MMRMTSVLAALAMMVAMAGPAMAGSVTGSWGPIKGYGYGTVYETQQPISFATRDGGLTIAYEPPDPDGPPIGTGYLSLGTGSAGYGFYADQDIEEYVSGDNISFYATYGEGGSVWADFVGNPPDVASWQLVSVGASTPYHGIDGGLQITFYGGMAPPVPEPSSGLLLAAGIAGGGLLGRRRRARPA